MEVITHEEAHKALANLPSVNAVRKLEALIEQVQQVDLSTTNLVHGQMCARTIFIPAGTILTGVLTNVDNICVLVGDITVTTNDGPRRLTGFNVIPATSGFKRAGIAHSDTWWTTIHNTQHTDMHDIETEMSDEWEKLQTNRLAIASDKHIEIGHQEGGVCHGER